MSGSRGINLHKQLPSEIWRSGARPTAVSLVVCPKGGVMLVQPKKAKPNGWIFPQGGIERQESPYQAALRELQEELGWTEDVFDSGAPALLGQGRTKTSRGEHKIFFVVYHEMMVWKTPVLNKENRNWHTANGPNDLWSRTSDCSPQKKRLLKGSLVRALQLEILCGQRWNIERARPMLHNV